MARRLAFVSSTIQFHVVRSCYSVYFVFSVAVCGTTDQSEEHLDVHRSSLRRVSLAARFPVFVFSLEVLVCTLHSRSEVLGQMHTHVKTTDVYVGRLVCRVGARRPRCTEIHGVIVRKIARQGGAGQLKLVATTRFLINPSVFEEVFVCAFRISFVSSVDAVFDVVVAACDS